MQLRLLKFLLTIAFASFPLAAPSKAADFNAELFALLPNRIQSSKVVRVASPRQSPPYIFEQDGVLSGVAPSLGDEIEKILGVKFEYLDVQ